MSLTIRQEQPQDHPAVFQLLTAAFQTADQPDPDEPRLVERLRRSDAFIPDLSLVATLDHQVVGHLLLTHIAINDGSQAHPSLALAPVSVLPAYQGRGIGGALIQAAHRLAAQLGHGSVVLLGHAAYYPRFGYQRAADFGIELPFEVPAENCMVLELGAGGLDGVKGMVVYDGAFFE